MDSSVFWIPVLISAVEMLRWAVLMLFGTILLRILIHDLIEYYFSQRFAFHLDMLSDSDEQASLSQQTPQINENGTGTVTHLSTFQKKPHV